MAVRLKLLVAFAAAAVVVSLAGTASAKPQRAAPRPSAPEQSTQTPPVSFPRQFFAAKGVQPLTPEIEQSLKPADSFKECDVCPEMVMVPKGSFTMGTPASEPQREPGEDPQHRVTLAQPFAVGRFSISFDEWDACLADGGCDDFKGSDGGFGRGRLPAAGITFAAAKSYLGWISKKVGRTYRLPSESEREYFARAGTTTPFWFGNTISAKQANYATVSSYNNAGNIDIHDNGPRLVDSYTPNKFGLYQVHGNVREWTEDCYNKRYTQDKPGDGSPWLDGNCTKRMARGGYWLDLPDKIRSGARYGTDTAAGLSFRVVRTLNLPVQ
jgi:formylglycine-generating enzyme required for sulfatase activity